MGATKVVVAGAMANKPSNGGEAWVRLSWIRGLQRLGCEVWFIEEIEERNCTDCSGLAAPFATSVNRAWFHEVVREFGFSDRAWLVCDSGEVDGPSLDGFDDVAGDSLLVNISGHLRAPRRRELFRTTAFVDIDPGYTQIWHAQGAGTRITGHDLYFTIGTNIGTPHCEIPTVGLEWLHVQPPVVLDDWRRPLDQREGLRMVTDAEAPRFTTIATWRGPFGPVEMDRRRFGLKVHEFRKFIALPGRAPAASFEAALAIHPAEVNDLGLLADHGWELADPRQVAGSTTAFMDYVQQSSAEFSVAQGVYVETASGWFSDRSTRYLASGRPVLVQDTGFSRSLPVGQGLVTFSTLDEAVAGVESIRADYDQHSGAAREVAARCFDSDVVLARLLEQCGAR